jgi:membrane dipeptidase
VDDRGTQLHVESVVVDAHSDVFNDVLRRRQAGETNVLRRLHVPAWRAGGVDAVVTTLYVEGEHKPDRALRRAMALLGAALNDVDEAYEIAICRTRAEIDAAVSSGQIAFILAIEGGECIQDGIESLRVFYQLGVRVLGLTWNQRNQLADGVGEERSGGGLTELGRDMVREANRLGILLDVSHLSIKSFWDLLEESDAPVVASHSNAKRLCGHRRNLDDEQIRALIDSGGMVGVNGVASFIDDVPANATIERMLDHIDHIVEVAGAENVGLGPDFVDFMGPQGFGSTTVEMADGHVDPVGFATTRDMPNVTAGLLARGYSDAQIRGILGENFLRVLTRVTG